MDGGHVDAAGDGTVVVAAEAAHKSVAGERAAFAQCQVLEHAALTQAAHKALAVLLVVEYKALNGMARAVESAGVGAAVIADGGPAAVCGDGDIGGQHRAGVGGGGSNALLGGVPVDQRRKPEELAGVGDSVHTAVQNGGLVPVAECAEAVAVKSVVVLRAGFVGVVGITRIFPFFEGAVTVGIAYGVDGAVGAVQQGEAVFRLAVVQVLEPGMGTRSGGIVEQVGHLAGGELVGRFGCHIGRGAAADTAALVSGVQPVAVPEGASVDAADATHIAAAADRAGGVAVGDGAEVVVAADAAHIAAAADPAGGVTVDEIAGFVAAAEAAHIVTAAGDRAAVGAAAEGGVGADVVAAEAAHIVTAAGDRATVGTALDSAIAVAADAAHIAAAADLAGVMAVFDGAGVIAAEAARIVSAADLACIGAALDGAAEVYTADAARISDCGGGRAVVGAVLDGACVVAAEDAHKGTAADRAACAHGQVLDLAVLVQAAHKALVVEIAFELEALDGVARAVKGAGVWPVVIAHGGPVVALGDGDVLRQHRAGREVLFLKVGLGAVPVDHRPKPEELAGVGDFVHTAVQNGGLVLAADRTEALVAKIVVVPRADCVGVVGIAPDIALDGAVAIQVAYGVDGAVAAIQHGESVAALTQVLEPGQGTRAGGTVEQVHHLAGGKLVGGFGFRLGADAVIIEDAVATGGVQPVAVGEGAAV